MPNMGWNLKKKKKKKKAEIFVPENFEKQGNQLKLGTLTALITQIVFVAVVVVVFFFLVNHHKNTQCGQIWVFWFFFFTKLV